MPHKRMSFEFGMLPWAAARVDATDWAIEPLPNLSEKIKEWKALGPSPRWVHPPIMQEVRLEWDPSEQKERKVVVPDSDREAPLWSTLMTHRLVYNGSRSLNRKTTQRGRAAFLIYLAGAVYGVELQHRGWTVGGKQHKTTSGLFIGDRGNMARLLDQANAWYTKASQEMRTTAIAALYLHNHIPSMKWDWERFAWQYSIFDAAWSLARASGLISAMTKSREWPHRLRLREFARRFRLRRDASLFQRVVHCRNNLVHQVTWGRVIVGHAPRRPVRLLYLPLRSFATIALFACMDVRGPYRRARWKGPAKELLEVS